MRLWSLHPRYLDRQGLTAAWREGLLAQKVLTGTTKGYRNHPQLVRFTLAGELPAPTTDAAPLPPGPAITTYLHGIADEATARGYAFDRALVLAPPEDRVVLEVTDGQVRHEWAHLLAKLAHRSPAVHTRWRRVVDPQTHGLFVVVPGPVAEWEILGDTAGPD
ncbi:MAG: hypothetical protein JWP95_2336 [Actinotalea sp.]|nr:hypothetical protein [Actinotalea sp.]